MNKEITINKQAKSITIINNGIAFSQFGIAKEILDLVDNQQQEIDRLNNIINELENTIANFIENHTESYIDWKYDREIYLAESNILQKLCDTYFDKLKELKDSD